MRIASHHNIPKTANENQLNLTLQALHRDQSLSLRQAIESIIFLKMYYLNLNKGYNHDAILYLIRGNSEIWKKRLLFRDYLS